MYPPVNGRLSSEIMATASTDKGKASAGLPVANAGGVAWLPEFGSLGRRLTDDRGATYS